MNKAVRGFTLIELMVVIGIIGILAAIVFVGARPAGEQSRDAARQSDLRQVQTALELYKNRYGRYPERCANAADWSGQMNTDYECNTPNQPYILGSVGNSDPADDRPFAEFMVNLPKDPKLNGDNSGYVYTVNAEGTVYKFMAKNTVESEEVDYDHPFKSCDVSYDFAAAPGVSKTEYTQACDPPNPISDSTEPGYGCDIAMCDRLYGGGNVYSSVNNPPAHCRFGRTLGQFEASYAVWGGVADAITGNPGTERYRVSSERQTENILCQVR